MGYEDNMAYFTSKWMSDIMLRNDDSACNDFSCATGNWWGGEKFWTCVEVEKILNVLCSRCNRTSNRELNVTRVDAHSVTAVVMLKLKWQRAGNGSVLSVDWRDTGY